MADVKGLVEEIAKALVDTPDQVDVREVGNGNSAVIELRVASGDFGKIIGKQGRTARSIRTLVTAAGVRSNRRISLDIVE